MPKVKLVDYSRAYMDIIKLACSKPYGNKVGDKGVQEIIKSGHLSILEHISVSFEIECSVRVLGQLTRHRHHSFTVQSARGKMFDVFIDPITLEEWPLQHIDVGKCYQAALDEGMTFEQAAYYLPQGVKTSMVVTANARAWYEYLPKRVCKRAMPEHRLLAKMFRVELKKAMPEIFDKDFMNCKNCTEKSCEFK